MNAPYIAALDALATKLQSLDWLTEVYPRAVPYRQQNPDNTWVDVPKVYSTEQNQYVDVLPDERVVARSFFYSRYPEEYQDNGYGTRQTSLIVWVNFDKIDASYQDPLFQTDYLAQQVYDALKGSDVQFIGKYDFDAEQVFDNIPLTDMQKTHTLRPFGGFRFELRLEYDLCCADC